MTRLPVLSAAALLLLSALPMSVEASHSGPGTPFSSSATVRNIPAGCSTDFADGCYHMRTGLNDLDSPIIDVLILVPGSPWAERDMRTMRAAVEMYEAGFSQLALEEGMDWLAEGVEFHITVDRIDPVDGAGGEFTTYPIVDPEIVVIANNPVVSYVQGIGIDPIDFIFTGKLPCHGIANPFDIEAWEALPGFDSHHDGRSGTYTEHCGGAGGSICFAINNAIDPVPGVVDDVLGMNMFDLVAHEVGHCLTLGHVGDAGDHATSAWPRDDIMSYTHDAGISGHKCVSTLDLETFATTMSIYLDANGDGSVSGADRVYPNDISGDEGFGGDGDGDPFQVQHPSTHRYASPTGLARDCPVPDTALVSGVDLTEGGDDGPDPDPYNPQLQSGQPRNVAVSSGESVLFHIDVPAGAGLLLTQTSAPCEAPGAYCSFDVDLYVRRGAVPTDTTYDCRPFTTGSDETCENADPAADRWHIRLLGYTGSGVVKLTSTVDPTADLDGDGTLDHEDADRDGDGVDNAVEVLLGQDPDSAQDAPSASEVVVCAPNASSTGKGADKDGDGFPAQYVRGYTAYTLHEDGTATTATSPGDCWIAGDPDDDGAQRVPQ